MYSRLSFVVTVLGVVLQLAGLAMSTALEAQDLNLTADDGQLALSKPGTLLFLVGLALIVLGVGARLLTVLLWGVGGLVPSPTGGARREWHKIAGSASALVAIVALALIGGVFGPTDAAFTGQANTSHVHDDTGRPSPQHLDEINISWERLREIDSMLATAKTATEEYQDVDLARTDGYQQVMGALYGTGAHFVNQQYLDESGFDPARPEALLYDRAENGGLELVGVAFMLPRKSDGETPPTYFGPLAAWHEHDFHRPCLTTRTSGHPVTVHGTEADCRAAGYVFIPPKFWMLHVWLFSPSPEGIFSHENSSITGPSDISVVGEVK